MVNWFAGVIFGIFLLFMAFYRNRPKILKNFIPSTKRNIISILSKIYNFPETCAIYTKNWIKFVIFSFWPKADRNRTRIRKFIKPISKRAKNRNFDHLNGRNSATISKSNNDAENTENSRSGKKGKIFWNFIKKNF